MADQLALLVSVAPTVPDVVDLRCCTARQLLDDLGAEGADLVIADPPWTYSQTASSSRPDDHYETMLTAEIVADVERASLYAPRLALWLTWPLLGEWEAHTGAWEWGRPVTGGAWAKSDPNDVGHYGPGYHWAGCSEPVLVYTRGAAHNDRTAPLRNAWHEPAGLHSRKPVGWQAQWIRRWVPPGGLVLDLYAGLGSVAEAVLMAGEGRRYLGAEVSPQRRAQALALVAQRRGW